MRKRAKIIGVVIFFVAIIVAVGIFYTQWHARRLQVAGLETWVSEQVPHLLSFRPSDETPVLRMKRDGECWTSPEEGAPFFHGVKGLIRLHDGKWVYFTAFSSHGRGNLVLAVDSEGSLWACNGHICPTLILGWDNRPTPDEITLENFIASRVPMTPGAKGSPTWCRVDEWKE